MKGLAVAIVVALASQSSAQEFPGQPFDQSCGSAPAVDLSGYWKTNGASSPSTGHWTLGAFNLIVDTDLFVVTASTNVVSINGTLGVGPNQATSALFLADFHNSQNSQTYHRTKNDSSGNAAAACNQVEDNAAISMCAYSSTFSDPLYASMAVVQAQGGSAALMLEDGGSGGGTAFTHAGVVRFAVDDGTLQTLGNAPTSGAGTTCTNVAWSTNATDTAGVITATCTVGQIVEMTFDRTHDTTATICMVTPRDANAITAQFVQTGATTTKTTFTALTGIAAASNFQYFCIETK